ncbi:MAG: hypothetical protein MMC33_000099 [Icmadophila ericetorum]|nr:hypothetical protein [Icmadophila ericetorum]
MSTSTSSTPSTTTTKPPILLTRHPTSTLHPNASLFPSPSFPITLSAGTIIHPRAQINATYGSVQIGEGCILWEKCRVGLQQSLGEEGEGEVMMVVLGRNVIVEAGAVIQGRSVGDGTVVDAGARVGRGAVIGKHCRITPLTTVPAGAVIEDFTVLYGDGLKRRGNGVTEELRARGRERKGEVLRRLVPGR